MTKKYEGTVIVKMDPKLKKELQEKAMETGIENLSSLIRLILTDYISQFKK